MDCEMCANYKPVEVERPTDHPGRVFTEDLRIGMVIRRHGTRQARRLAVILEIPASNAVTVKALQFLAGLPPIEETIALAMSGLRPYLGDGRWQQDVWYEEVT